GVGELVAVVVLEDDVLAESLAVADLLDRAVVDRDDRGVLASEDVDAAAGGGVGDHVGGVAGGALGRGRALGRGDLGEVVGVTGLGGDREVGALGQAGERVDDAARQVAVLLGVEEDLVDVPVGVVV